MPTAAEARALFRAFLREGRKFPNYNIREYVQRRAREGFVDARSVTDTAALEQLWQRARQELEVVRRQSVVYSLYARKHKSVMWAHCECSHLAWELNHELAPNAAGST